MAASLLTQKLVKNHAAPSQVVPCMTATEAERGCAAAQAKKCLVLPAQAKGGRPFPLLVKGRSGRPPPLRLYDYLQGGGGLICGRAYG